MEWCAIGHQLEWTETPGAVIGSWRHCIAQWIHPLMPTVECGLRRWGPGRRESLVVPLEGASLTGALPLCSISMPL